MRRDGIGQAPGERVPRLAIDGRQLTARRVPGASPDDYGWEIGPGIHEGRPPVAVLRPAERDEWPVQIRRAGVTRKSPVIFRDAVDRMVFAIDFGL